MADNIGNFQANLSLNMTQAQRQADAFLRNIGNRRINLQFNGAPLGRISRDVSAFEKSLEAANSRVVAFAGSASLIAGIGAAFKKLVSDTINIEKIFTDINVVLNANTEDFKKFGSELFNVAKITGQSIDAIADSAKEFSRQGLNVDETLKRTNASAILIRQSGLDAADSVRALTVALNTFNKEGIDAYDVINRLANVDANFAVSSKDLADAISRVGSSAEDAGVSFNELLGIVTSLAQNTGRTGAVIGNALKSIFTRTQRSDTLDELEKIGVAVRDLGGKTLPAIQILQNLANVQDDLSDSQKSFINELVGGVFQINQLKAALNDLSKETGIYSQAVDTANQTTDEAIRRNAQLNQTFAAQLNAVGTSFTQLASTLGQDIFGPVLKKLIGIGTEITDSLNGEGIGAQIGKSIAAGIGNVLSGPGLAIGTILLAKLTAQFGKFAIEAGRNVLSVSEGFGKIGLVQQNITALAEQDYRVRQALLSNTLSRESKELAILRIIEQQVAAVNTLKVASAAVAPGIVGAGIRGTSSGGFKNRAGGQIPLTGALAEVAGAKKAGYSINLGDVRMMNAAGGAIIYNSKEKVIPNFGGSGQPAIIPPNGFINAATGLKPIPKTGVFSLADYIQKAADIIGDDFQRMVEESINEVVEENRRRNFASARSQARNRIGGVSEFDRARGLARDRIVGTTSLESLNRGAISDLRSRQILDDVFRSGSPNNTTASYTPKSLNNRLNQLNPRSNTRLPLGTSISNTLFRFNDPTLQDKISNRALLGGLATSFAGGALGSLIGGRGGRTIEGATNALGAGATIAGTIPGPAGVVIGSVVAAFGTLKAVVDSTRKSFEEIEEETNNRIANRGRRVAAGESFAGAAQTLEDVIARGGGPAAREQALRNFRSAYVDKPFSTNDFSAQGIRERQNEFAIEQKREDSIDFANAAIFKLAEKGGRSLLGFGPAKEATDGVKKELIDAIKSVAINSNSDEFVVSRVRDRLQRNQGKNETDQFVAVFESLKDLGVQSESALAATEALGTDGIPSVLNFIEQLKRVNKEAGQAAKSAEGFLGNLKKFSDQFAISSAKASAQRDQSNALFSESGRSRIGLLNTVSDISSPFGNSLSQLSNKSLLERLQISTDTQESQRSLQDKAFSVFRGVDTSKSLSDNPAIQNIIQKELERGLNSSNPLKSLTNFGALFRGQSLNENGKEVLKAIESQLIDLNKESETIRILDQKRNDTLNQQTSLLRTNAQIQKALQNFNTPLGERRGSNINGLNSTLGLNNQRFDRDFQQKQRLDFAGLDANGRAAFVSRENQKNLARNAVIGQGIIEDFKNGNLAQQADILSARPEDRDRLTRNSQRAQGQLASIFEQSFKQEIREDASNLIDALIKSFGSNSFGSLVPNKQFDNLRNGASAGNFGLIQSNLQTLNQYGNQAARSNIAEVLERLNVLINKQLSIPDAARLRANQETGGRILSPEEVAAQEQKIAPKIQATIDVNVGGTINQTNDPEQLTALLVDLISKDATISNLAKEVFTQKARLDGIISRNPSVKDSTPPPIPAK